MKNCTVLLLSVVFIFVDVGVNLLAAHFANTSSVKQLVSDYSFGKSTIDLVLLSYLRLCLVVGSIIGIFRSKNEGVKRLRSIRRAVVNFSITLCLVAAIKLLYFAEDSKHELDSDAGVQAFFCIAAISNACLYIQWTLLKGIKFCQLGKGNVINVDGEDASDEEKESLLSESTDFHGDDHDDDDDDEDDHDDYDDDASEKGSRKKTRQKRSLQASVWKLVKYCKPDAPFIFLGFVFLLVASICEIFLPYFSGQVINAIAIEKSYAMFKKYIILMLSVALAASLAAGFRGAIFNYVMARFTIRIQNFLFEHIMRQEVGFFDSKKTGAIISRLTSDTTKMGDQISLNINIFLRSCIKIVGILIFMAKLSWKLTIITIVGTPILVMISEAYGEYYERIAAMVQDSLALANEAAEESISSVRTVKSFAAENIEIERYRLGLRKTFKLKIKESIAFGGYRCCTEVCFLAMEVLVLFYGGHLVMQGDLSGGYLVSFSFYSFDLSGCIEDIGDIYTSLMEAVGASHKVFAYIEREPRIKNNGTEKPKDFKGAIEFRDVSFSYPTRPDLHVLNSISFAIQPGEIVALVGPSGGGKSTVVKLLEHFYEPNVGSVLIDGIPVQNFDHHFIHNKVALVAQEPTLFARSIADNIRYGLGDVDKNEVEQVAGQSNAHNFITEMPEGYETETGEKGVQLSGGQKQRVAIARALIRNPTILILDEATSALDADSECLVQEAINRNLADRTVIIVAHRLSTIEVADKILVIDKGQVMEQGTHKELLEKDGIYARLVKKQIHGQGKDAAVTGNSKNDDEDGFGHDATTDSASSSDGSESLEEAQHSPPKSFGLTRSLAKR